MKSNSTTEPEILETIKSQLEQLDEAIESNCSYWQEMILDMLRDIRTLSRDNPALAKKYANAESRVIPFQRKKVI